LQCGGPEKHKVFDINSHAATALASTFNL